MSLHRRTAAVSARRIALCALGAWLALGTQQALACTAFPAARLANGEIVNLRTGVIRGGPQAGRHVSPALLRELRQRHDAAARRRAQR
jgi:hypothetical protein